MHTWKITRKYTLKANELLAIFLEYFLFCLLKILTVNRKRELFIYAQKDKSNEAVCFGNGYNGVLLVGER